MAGIAYMSYIHIRPKIYEQTRSSCRLSVNFPCVPVTKETPDWQQPWQITCCESLDNHLSSRLFPWWEMVVFFSTSYVANHPQPHDNHISCRVTKSENFPDSKIFVANFSDKARKSRQFSNLQQMPIKGGFDHPHSFQIIRTHFLDQPDTFRIIQKLSRLSRHTSRLSRLFSDYPDTFSRFTGHS